MNHQNAADAYRQSAFENAPPIKILRMLYQGAIRFLDQALEQDPADPMSDFLPLLYKVDDIVSELRLALQPEHDPEVSANLERLYLFVEDALAQATLDRSTEPIGSVRLVLATLLAAWNDVEVEQSKVA